jgi:hypothetical protein
MPWSRRAKRTVVTSAFRMTGITAQSLPVKPVACGPINCSPLHNFHFHSTIHCCSCFRSHNRDYFFFNKTHDLRGLQREWLLLASNYPTVALDGSQALQTKHTLPRDILPRGRPL